MFKMCKDICFIINGNDNIKDIQMIDILAAFQISYYFFLLVVRTAATLTNYVLLHTLV